MYRRGDPRWNRTIQHISENLEHANETAAENIYGFTQRYVNPCVASLTRCCNAATAPCFPSSNDRRRNRARSRGRAERNFDFYDDWDDDETDGLLGWGSDNLERFLGTAANYGATQQPGRQRAMSYGQRARDPRFDRRKSSALPRDAQDPTLIPSSSYLGFLPRLPFQLGGKALRYKPSAADLTDHPGALRRSLEEEQPLMEDSGEDALDLKTHRRARSNTHTSGHTSDSRSSRGDIFPSEDELDDAVPLDDEFTIALERRTTGQWDESASGNGSGGNTRSASKRPSRSASSRTVSSGRRSADAVHEAIDELHVDVDVDVAVDAGPSLADLQAEEDQLRRDEEAHLERKRIQAQHLAVQRGLAPASTPSASTPSEEEAPSTVRSTRSPASEATAPQDALPLSDPTPHAAHEELHALDTKPSSPSRPLTAVKQGQSQDAFVPACLPNFGD